MVTASASDASEVLRGFWYPALPGVQVRRRKLRATTLLGVPLVMGRDPQGVPFALRDACPHRGMPLSFGRLDGDTLECCYHGWRFDPTTGQCREIPSLASGSTVKVEQIFATRFRCDEQDGYIWVYMPNPASPDTPVPPVPRLPVFSQRYRLTHVSLEFPGLPDDGIVGLIDPAHGPFVHDSWWWRSPRGIVEKEKVFEPIPDGFRMQSHTPSANSTPYKLLGLRRHTITTTIDFVLPNIRLERIHCGPYWVSNRLMSTPLTSDQCRMDFWAAWNILPWAPFAATLFRLLAWNFLRQDQRNMARLARGLQRGSPTMLIGDADRPAKWYLQLKRAHLEARRSGRPMDHPLKGPVTLRWRS